jgi:hypothetical protein
MIHGVSVGIPASSVAIMGRVVAFTCAGLVLVHEAPGEGVAPISFCSVGVGVEMISRVRVGVGVTAGVVSFIPRLSGVRGRQEDKTNHKPRTRKTKWRRFSTSHNYRNRSRNCRLQSGQCSKNPILNRCFYKSPITMIYEYSRLKNPAGETGLALLNNKLDGSPYFIIDLHIGELGMNTIS